MNTGENEQGLRKILDMTRLISILVLAIHFYYCCYRVFEGWKLSSTLTNTIISNIANTGLFNHFNTSKILALCLLFISLLGVKGKPHQGIKIKTAIAYIIPDRLFIL